MTIGETVTLESLERDPYPIYARLRDEEPVSFVPAVGLWLVSRHDDVKRVTNDPETFTAATEPSTLNRTMGENMLGMEGPEQRWIRAIIEVPFRPRDVEERTQGMIPRLADELIDGFVERGEADLFHEYADPMSVRSLCFMLGLDEVPWQDILHWNEGQPDARARELRGRSREAGAGRRGRRGASRGDRRVSSAPPIRPG
jgi:cytochrome P450